MIFLFIFIFLDTLKYDDGIIDGFYEVGEYNNDKIGIKFFSRKPLEIIGVIIFCDSDGIFLGGSLCKNIGNIPDTSHNFIKIDTIYAKQGDWCFTPINWTIKDSIFWFVLNLSISSPQIGGDTNTPSHFSYCYSNTIGWKVVRFCDWLIRLIVNPNIPYYEDFSILDPNYTGEWKFGIPTIITPHDGNCFGTSLDSPYANNISIKLISPWLKVKSFNLSVPTLSFFHYYKTEYICDGGNVKISSDGTNWIIIHPTNGYDTIISGASGIDGERGFTGHSIGWEKEYFILPQWDSLKIMWTFGSDPVVSDEGWFIDNVKISDSPIRDVFPFFIYINKFVPPESTIIPKAKIMNISPYKEGIFNVFCEIESSSVVIYRSRKGIEIEPFSSKEIEFYQWRTGKPGSLYRMKVYTELIDDDNKPNDTIKKEIISFPIIKEFTSGFTTSPPIIDGIIDTNEWRIAKLIDGTNIESIRIPNSCNLYFMNSPSYLYIGVKSDSIQEIRLYFDELCNKRWEQNGSDGFYWVTQNTFAFQDMYYNQNYNLDRSLFAFSNKGVELALPIGREKQYIPPIDSICCFIYVKAKNKYMGWYPQITKSYTDMDNYAKIRITEVGIEDNKLVENIIIEIYPNPFRSNAKIKIKAKEIAPLKIYNIAGECVSILRYNNKNEVINWNTNLPQGVYFIVYTSNHNKVVKKFTIL